MSTVGFAPEFVRNARIQLRPGRTLATIIICAIASLAAVAWYDSSAHSNTLGLLHFVISIQIAVLLIGGGIYCLQSIHREKELNTFDFQRLTRLTPFELAVGKLLGAPVLTFLIVLCLMPFALWAAFEAGVTFYVLAEAYGILLLGTLVFGLFTLLISLLLGRGASAGAILFYLAVLMMSSIDYGAAAGSFAVHTLSPFFAPELFSPGSASVLSALPPLQDLFFGVPVPHVLALALIYVTFSAWLLLALLRNIKKDPSVYEIFSPLQALLFVLYLNFLMLGFFRWAIPDGRGPVNFRLNYRPIPAADAERTLLALSLWFFVILGFSLLRNRERTRRHISRLGSRAAGWWASAWPAPYLISGALILGFSVIAMIHRKLPPDAQWSTGMGMVEVLFFALWLARDAAYLQWMNIRRARRPLVSGVLYLAVFYACTGTLIAAFRVHGSENGPYAAALIPSSVFGMDLPSWLNHQSAWLVALGLLVLEIVFFAWLQRRELQALLSTTPVQAEI